MNDGANSASTAEETALVAAIKELVEAGEYRDELFGVPGRALEGANPISHASGSSVGQRVYARGTEEHSRARAAGLVERLPPLVPAPLDAVDEVESLLGCRLPSLLKRLYVEVGNGGFGPGYGVLGLTGGHRDDVKKTATDLLREGSFPPTLLPISYWGCAIYSLVEPTSATMWGFDPNNADDEEALYVQSISLSEWLRRWLDGRLEQPWVLEDPGTGRWRGATDEDYRLAWLEVEGS